MTATSFFAFIDPNGVIQLTQVFINETLTFRFDGPLDDGNFGGFLTNATGAPTEFLGIGPTINGAVPYFAYADQAAARASFEVRENVLNAPVLASYIVGRHRDDPDTLVIDPSVPAVNSFGLPFSFGFGLQTEFTYRIPIGNEIILASGFAAQPTGVDPSALQLTVNRYFRFRTTMWSNTVTNTSPSYDHVIAAIVITP